MVGDNSKRRSLLFPFRAPKQETKFEVVNRKRSPLSQQQKPQPVEDRLHTTPTIARAQPPATVPTIPSVPSAVPKPPSNAKPAATKQQKQPSQRYQSLLSHDVPQDNGTTISLSDVPQTNLNVNVDLPPVPDYNSRSFAPAVTIQGRTVSMAKKDAPPRRKPPALTNDSNSNSTPATPSSLEQLSKVTTGMEAMSQPSVDIANQGVSDSKHTDFVQRAQAPKIPEILVSESSDRDLPKQDVIDTQSGAPEPAVHQAREEVYNDDNENTSEDSDFSFVKQHTEVNAKAYTRTIPVWEPFQPPLTPSLFQTVSSKSVSSAEFFDAQETTIRSDIDLDKILPDLHDVKLEEDSPEDDMESIDESEGSVNDSDESIGEVRPLNFHRKTVSDAAAMVPSYTVPPTTHKKQLSLSDEIMRDIDKFQTSRDLHHETHDDDQNIEVSPVTPLWKLSGIQDTLNSREADTPGNSLEQSLGDALFHDSSDDDNDQEVGRRPSYMSYDAGKTSSISINTDSQLLNRHTSQASSLYPEINYKPSPTEWDTSSGFPRQSSIVNGESIPTRNANGEPIPSVDGKAGGTPATADIHGRFSSEEDVTPSRSNEVGSPDSSALPGSFPETVVESPPSSKDFASPYSYESPEQRKLHVVHDSEDEEDHANRGMNSPVDTRPRTFHVVNDGNYSVSDADSFDVTRGEQFNNNDFSVVHQASPVLQRSIASSEVLSFTAKSPTEPPFNLDTSPNEQFGGLNNMSNGDLSVNESVMASIITPQQSVLMASDPNSPMMSEYEPLPATNAYDRRANDVVAPVAYVTQTKIRPQRLAPPGVPTRSGRSASLTKAMSNYNTVKEDVEVQPVMHEPQKSQYVELLRLGTGTTNSNVPAQKWGLPIGISANDYAKFASARATYKRPTRLHKNDLKHGKIKQRQLALEVGDDEDDESLTVGRDSAELKRLDSVGTSSLHAVSASPSHSTTMSFSPKRDPNVTTLGRSGTIVTDKIFPQVSVGRSGTVRDAEKGHMTLFIANPDIDEEND